MRPDTVLKLGAFQFASFEIPTDIPFGGGQHLVTHNLVGGMRVIDAMGPNDRAIEWSGIFMGSTANQRARFLDTMRRGGQVQTLTWSQYSYSVIIEDYEPDFRRQFEIPYRIRCAVISDNTQPVTQSGNAPIDAAIGSDLDQANILSALISDQQLTTLMTALTVARAGLITLSGASHAQVNSLLLPLTAVQGRVGELLATSNSSAATAPGFAGVEPFGTASQIITTFNAQVTNSQTLNNLVNLNGLLGRMAQNLNGINASETSVGVAGGNLFDLAAKQYGDPQAWTTIARANGLTDPFVQGPAVLAIPPQPDNAGGILNA